MAVLGLEKSDRVVGYGLFAGVVITTIGIRFMVWPQSAADSFGLGTGGGLDSSGGQLALCYVIGLRDIWLGVLVFAAALGRAFYALGLWFLVGFGVCMGDAGIVVAFSGPAPAIVFHVLSGVFCGIVGLVAFGLSREA